MTSDKIQKCVELERKEKGEGKRSNNKLKERKDFRKGVISFFPFTLILK